RRLGEWARGDPVARARRSRRPRGRTSPERARVSLPLRATAALAGPAGRGRIRLVPRVARARRARADLPDARRAAERDRPRGRTARRALPVPVPPLGRSLADPEQALAARGGGEGGNRGAALGDDELGRGRARLPRPRKTVVDRRVQAAIRPPGLPLRDAPRGRARLHRGGGVRAARPGIYPG